MTTNPLISTLFLDLRYAARALKRQPSFAAAVALTLALGLGVNATLLGMMDALLFRPFQFPDYQRLIVIWETPTETPERQPVSPANYLDWRRQATTVERLVAWEGWGATLTRRNEPERVQGFRVSPQFFETLGVPPAIGRSFTDSEGETGNDRRVVIGNGLWKRHFGGDPAVVGTEILLDGEPYTLVGIAPPGFDFPVGSQAWAPLAFAPERAADRSNRTLTVLGKLAPDKSLEDAQAELTVISRRLTNEYPDTNRARGALVRTMSTAFREDSGSGFVAILQLGGGLVLLVACANLVGLLLARGNDRQREIAVRTALGASRARIVRQMITEVVLLALIASALALLAAQICLELLRSSIPVEIAQHIEGWNNVRLDGRLLWVTPTLAIALGVLVSLVPAIGASGNALNTALKEGERGAAAGVGRQRVRQALVVTEIAFALTLLVAAGLVLGSGVRMVNDPGGFDARQVLRFDIPLSESKYPDPVTRQQIADNLLARIEAIPVIERAAIANILPAAGWNPSTPFMLADEPVADPARRPRAGYRAVSTAYFKTMRIPIVSGREFSTFDRNGAQQVAIISRSLAERFWPGSDALGKRILVGEPPATWVTIVGVAGDVAMYNWWDGLDYSAVYVPLSQSSPPAALSVAVRTWGEPAAATRAIRSAVASADPLLAVDNPRTMHQSIVSSTFGLNFLASLMGICGGIALVLSFVGIYSMMSYAVSQRIHEFGVRMALGATARDVLVLTMKQAGIVTTAGLVIGLGLALVLGRLMASAMEGIIALDSIIFAAMALALAVVSLTAAYVPARRSVRLDAATILRAQ